jgi:hypothetical protein
VMLVTAFSATAQQANSKWINAVVGLNSSWIIYQNAYGNPEIEYSTTFGFTGGMGMTYFINEQWGVSGTFMATKAGQNYAGVQSGGDATRKVHLSYMEIPLLITKHIDASSPDKPTWISFGPDILVLLKAQQEYVRKGGDPLPNPEGMKVGDIRERFNTTDVALNFAINKMYKMSGSDNVMFLLSFNTAIGLTDINSIEWKTPQIDGTYSGSHNFYIGIKAGLMFKASKEKKD